MPARIKEGAKSEVALALLAASYQRSMQACKSAPAINLSRLLLRRGAVEHEAVLAGGDHDLLAVVDLAGQHHQGDAGPLTYFWMTRFKGRAIGRVVALLA